MYFVLIIIIVTKVSMIISVELDLINCGVDHEEEVTEGDVELYQYPWLGILYYKYFGEVGESRATTTVILIHVEFVIGAAADIGPMPKTNFRRYSRVLLGESWNRSGRRVRNYVIHPEYDVTYNTVALVQLADPVRDNSIKPLCPPPEILKNPTFYVIKMKEDFNTLEKEVISVMHIPGKMCKDFYVAANLYSKKMRPPHVACAVSLNSSGVCVWGAGSALVSRDVWGRWQLTSARYRSRGLTMSCCACDYGNAPTLSDRGSGECSGLYYLPINRRELGVGVRGPGCGAPSRYLDMMSYYPWVEHSLSQFQRITISRISKQKYVLRTSESGSYQRFGACDPEEKINLVYREMIVLRTDNNQYQFLTYNMSIYDSVEYSCLTLELVNATAVSEMKIEHFCPRKSYGPACYSYKGSVFSISVYLMFSDTCRFEMFAWGWKKNMKLIDIQEWKWEEGTYYEDFTMQPIEYKGQTYMTDFGFEPLDLGMWLPDYDIWTTTEYDNTTTSSSTEFSLQGFTQSTTKTKKTKKKPRTKTRTTKSTSGTTNKP